MEGRAVVGDTLREGSVPVIELQAAMIVGPGSAAFEVIRDLVNHLPLMVTPKWVRRRSTPIALENVLTDTIAAADLPLDRHRVYEIAGPDILTYQEIMNIYGEFVGRKPRVIPVPVLTPKLSSYWLHLVTSVPATTAMSLVEGLSHDYVGDDHEIRALVPQCLLTFRESVAVTTRPGRRANLCPRCCSSSVATETSSRTAHSGGCDAGSTGSSAARVFARGAVTPTRCASATWWTAGACSD